MNKKRGTVKKNVNTSIVPPIQPVEDLHYKKEIICNNGKNIRRIFHIADIHIRMNNERDKEYEIVFRRLVDELKKDIDDKSIIVIAGDVMHEGYIYSGTSLKLVIKLFKKLLNLYPVILIAGNHDIKKNRTEYYDSLDPLRKITKECKHKLYYLRESGVYTYNNIYFGVSSVLDEKIIKAEYIPNDEKHKIAIYHGIVNGCLLQNGMRGEATNKITFNGYDLVLLGDIHKFQIMEGNMGYSSSLLQQNFGESIDEHGLISWQYNGDKKRFIPQFLQIKSDYGQIVYKIQNGKLVGDYPIDYCKNNNYIYPHNLKVRIIYENTEYQKVNEIVDVITDQLNKLNNNVISVSKVRESSEIKKGTTELINKLRKMENTKGYEQMIEDYYNDIYVDKNKKDEEYIKNTKKELRNIMEYNALISKNIKMPKNDDKFVTWIPLNFRFRNMFIYGKTENYIDFTKMNGIQGLIGENYSGKSSLIDAILFCIYGEHTKSKGVAMIINRNLDLKGDKVECTIQISANKEIYEISREAVIGKSKVQMPKFITCISHIDNKGTKKNLGKDQSIINNIVGKYEHFLISNGLLQKKKDLFFESEKKQIAILKDILGIKYFDELNDKASEDITKSKNKYLDLYKNNSPDYGKQLYETKKEKEINLTNITQKIESIKNNINDLRDNHKMMLSGIKKIDSKKYKINTKTFNVDKEKEKIDSLQQHIADLEKFNDTLNNNLMSVEYTESQRNSIIDKHTQFEKDKKEKIMYVNDKIQKFKKKIKCLYQVNDINSLQVQQQQLLNDKEDLLNELEIIHQKESDLATKKNKKKELKNMCDKYEEFMISIKNNDMEKNIKKKEMETLKKTQKKLIEHEYDKNCKYCVSNPFTIEAKNAVETLNKKDNEYKNICSKIESLQNESNKYKKFNDEYIKIKKEISDLKSYVNTKNNIDKNMLKIVSKLEEIKLDIDKCNINENNKKYNSKYESKIITLEHNLSELNSVVNEEYNKLIQSENELNKIKMEILKNENEILTMKNNINDINNNINEYNHFIDNNNNKIDNDNLLKKISLIESDIKTLNHELVKYESQLTSLHKEIAKDEEKIEVYEKSINDMNLLKDKLNFLYKYEHMTGDDGIQLLLLTKYLKNIEDRANIILAETTDFTIKIDTSDIDEDNKKKTRKQVISDGIIKPSKSRKKKINIYRVNKKGVCVDIGSCSGFELYIINISLRIGISENMVYNKADWFIIDEGDMMASDENNLMKTVNVLEILKSVVKFVILISHCGTIRSFCDSQLYIIKKDGSSHISNK